mmetsp:Transcript_21193/g.44560  ORF Transcript_21193/g.44560 Transcript_21193/m.44560 type:complete len:126 (-) Transcript_21193:866-1243(-)
MFDSNGTNNSYSPVNSDDFNDEDEADEYIRNQQVLMQQQDAGLDVLSQSVMRLGEMSNNIAEELGQQNKMLDSMETELDEAGEELDIITRSTKQLIAKSGGMSTFCLIAALSIVVLVLLFLVIYS